MPSAAPMPAAGPDAGAPGTPEAGDGRAARSRMARRLRRALRGVSTPVAVRFPDGSLVRAGAPGSPRITVVVRSGAALARALRNPGALGLGAAFVEGAIDVDGDLPAAVRTVHEIEAAAPWPARPWGAAGWLSRRRSRRAAPADIAFHYDVSNAFYALFLDPRMVYTCAYYPDPDCDLERAQEAKLDLVCRKLALTSGERLLDVGCGWGGLSIWAARHYGVEVRAVTLSAAQAEWAREAALRAGVADRVEVHHGDFRDLPPSLRADKIAAIGILEHQGLPAYPAYFGRLHAHLRPGGLLLNQCITRDPTARRSSAMAFLDRHVFPGGALASAGHVIDVAERQGFELLDVEGLRAHYARTTRDWLARLTSAAAPARALVGERRYRTWLAYLAGAAAGFEGGWIGLCQVLLRRPDPAAAPLPPARRAV